MTILSFIIALLVIGIQLWTGYRQHRLLALFLPVGFTVTSLAHQMFQKNQSLNSWLTTLGIILIGVLILLYEYDYGRRLRHKKHHSKGD